MSPNPETPSLRIGITHEIGRIHSGNTASTHPFDTKEHEELEASGEWTNLREGISIEVLDVDQTTGSFRAKVLTSSRRDLSEGQLLTFNPEMHRKNCWTSGEVPLLRVHLDAAGAFAIDESI